MYDIFGKFGAIRQIRIGTSAETKGTAYVVYEDIYDAKNACEKLSGFNVAGRFADACHLLQLMSQIFNHSVLSTHEAHKETGRGKTT